MNNLKSQAQTSKYDFPPMQTMGINELEDAINVTRECVNRWHDPRQQARLEALMLEWNRRYFIRKKLGTNAA